MNLNDVVRAIAIDYSSAKQWADVVHALAIIESHEDATKIGDGGRAIGILQQHPSFFEEYYGSHPDFPASVSDTETEAQIKTAAAFFERHSDLKLDIAVQAYNLGIAAVTKQGQRNPDYLARFGAAYQHVRATK